MTDAAQQPQQPPAPTQAPYAPQQPAPSPPQQQPRGFVGFMTTVPGVLTAFAAVITAAGGVWVGLAPHGTGPTPVPAPAPTTVTQTVSAPPPDVTAADTGSLRLGNADGTELGAAGTTLEDQCAAGDSSSCLQLLDQLVQECSDGYGVSCDALYLVSPVGSVLEEYGATCGYRFDGDVAGTCEDQ